MLYVFHDPGQALYRDDVVARSGCPSTRRLELPQHGPIHALRGPACAGLAVAVLHEHGRAPEIIEAEPGRERRSPAQGAASAGRRGTRAPEQIAVLTGGHSQSEVWQKRRFGNQVLWNGSYDDAGHSLGLAADAAPEQPTDTILCDSIRRFKGLEREVVVLVELDPSDRRFTQQMYVGATRARQHLVVTGVGAAERRASSPRQATS